MAANWFVVHTLVRQAALRQTLQYAQTGDVDVAIVALSLSLEEDSRWVLIPQELHAPIDQTLQTGQTVRLSLSREAVVVLRPTAPTSS